MMTRKNYETIAATFREQLDHDAEGAAIGALSDAQYRERSRAAFQIAGTLAFRLADDNPRFDRERFLSACGFCPTCHAPLPLFHDHEG